MNILKQYKGCHAGETAVIIGNGPSLDNTPLDELGKKYITFGSNKIYRKPFIPDYYCIIDEEMLNACLPLPDSITSGSKMFLRAEANIHANNPIYPIVATGFSLDISNFIVMGGTVTYALLQIAFYMGIRTVLLVGVDHHYPRTSRFKGYQIQGIADDPDHFTCADGKPYFEEGKTFNAPELDGTRYNYMIADELFKKDGRLIVNLTPGTKLDAFEKGTLDEWLTTR